MDGHFVIPDDLERDLKQQSAKAFVLPDDLVPSGSARKTNTFKVPDTFTPPSPHSSHRAPRKQNTNKQAQNPTPFLNTKPRKARRRKHKSKGKEKFIEKSVLDTNEKSNNTTLPSPSSSFAREFSFDVEREHKNHSSPAQQISTDPYHHESITESSHRYTFHVTDPPREREHQAPVQYKKEYDTKIFPVDGEDRFSSSSSSPSSASSSEIFVREKYEMIECENVKRIELQFTKKESTCMYRCRHRRKESVIIHYPRISFVLKNEVCGSEQYVFQLSPEEGHVVFCSVFELQSSNSALGNHCDDVPISHVDTLFTVDDPKDVLAILNECKRVLQGTYCKRSPSSQTASINPYRYSPLREWVRYIPVLGEKVDKRWLSSGKYGLCGSEMVSSVLKRVWPDKFNKVFTCNQEFHDFIKSLTRRVEES